MDYLDKFTKKFPHKTSSQLLESNANERSPSLLTPNIVAECNSSIKKTTIMSATPINIENLDITEYLITSSYN